MPRTISAGYATGISLTSTADNPVTITTGGTISATGSAAITGIGGGGYSWTIDNAGTLAGINTAADGILLGSNDLANDSRVTNETGAVISGGQRGLDINGTGTVVNRSGGIISSSGAAAVYLYAAGSITNAGTIATSGTIAIGAVLHAGGDVTNAAGATIAGQLYGISIGGPAASTITNAGVISASGSHRAIAFSNANGGNRLIEAPTASIAGAINGGTGTLELAAAGASRGTLTGFGGTVTNFANIQFDSGARWTIAGNGSAAGLGTVAINGFTNGDTIDLTGFSATSQTFANNALALTNAASAHATLNIHGSFTSPDFTIASDGAGGTDITVHTDLRNPIAGSYSYGITIPNSLGSSISVTGTITPATGNALYGPGYRTNSFIIDNAGLIGATSANGIQLGSYASNVSAGSVTNRSSGTISGGSIAVAINDSSQATVTNAGMISGGSYGVSIDGVGTVTNSSSGVITDAGLTGTSAAAVFIYGSGPSGNQPNVQIVNAGSLTGATGIEEFLGGSVTNAVGGVIAGQTKFGVFLDGNGTLVNGGTISGADVGARLYEGGNLVNLAGATISGSTGVYFGASGGTVTNAGTLIGTGPFALDFSAYNPNASYRLIVDPGAVFDGALNGGAGVLELAAGSGAGTLAGIGTTITNFATLQFDGAPWSVSGNAAGLTAMSAITGLAAGDTIDLTGFAATSESFANNALTLTSGAAVQTVLQFPDQSSIADFAFAPDGAGGTEIAGAGSGQVITWAGGSGDWNVAGNWLPQSVPQGFDTASIASPGSVTIGPAASNVVANLTIDGAGDTLAVDGSLVVTGTAAVNAGTLIDSGTLTAASIVDTAVLAFTGDHLLDNTPLSLGGTLAVQDSGTLTLGPGEIITQTGQSATIGSTALDSESIINQGTIDANSSGGSLAIVPLNFINNGTIDATGETLTVGYETTGARGVWSNKDGTIANAASLVLDGSLTTGDMGSITSAGPITEAGLLDNTGATLAVGSGSTLGTLGLISGGTVSGGTIVDTSGNGFAFGGGTLSGVTYQGPLDLLNPNDRLAVANGLAATVIDLIGSAATLDLTATQTLDNLTLHIGNAAGDTLRADQGGTVTLGQQASIVGNGGAATLLAGTGTTLDFAGTLTADTGDMVNLADGGGTFSNTGSIDINGGTIDVDTAIVAGSAGGTIVVGNGGVVNVATSVAADQTVEFTDASGLLRLEQPTGFAASITGFDLGSTIDLSNFVATDKSFADNVLTLTDASKAQVQLNIPGPFNPNEFVLTPDGGTGTNITWTAAPGTFTWTAASGNWATPTAWDLGSVPTGLDSAIIADGDTNTVTIDQAETIANLTLNGANDTVAIDVGGALHAGTITISAGTLTVTDTMAAAQVNDDGMLDIVSSHVLDDTPLSLGGTLLVSSAFDLPATLTLGTGEIVTQAGASAEIASSGNAQNEVLNQGTIEATFGGGTLTLAGSGSFANDGTIIVGNGETLNAASGVTAGVGGGTIEVGTGAAADFAGTVAAGETLAFTDATGVLRLQQPTGFAATIDGFTTGNTIDLAGISADTAVWSGGTLTISNAGTSVATLSMAGNYADAQFIAASDDAGGSLVTVTATCYAAGTRILTPRGEIAIERLRAGDLVQTLSGHARPIDWIGHRRVDFRRHPNRQRVLPVRIAAHAFGPGRPRRELLLSPDHAVFVEDVLIPIRHLINDTTIAQIPRQAITYYHIELPRHDVLLANGMPAESYLEAGARNAFGNGGGIIQLHPDFAPPLDHYAMLWEAHGYAPLVVTGPALEQAREALAGQAQRYRRSPRSRGVSSRPSAPAA